MKYLKLFEQFYEEESWWEEESPFDKIGKDLRIVRFKGGSHYILKEIIGDKIRLYDEDEHYEYWLKDFDLNPEINKNTIIYLLGKTRELTTNNYPYKDLPKEIKDRII